MVEQTQHLDLLFKSLADPTRRDILQRVYREQQTISQLAQNYNMSFAGVAKHLTVMEKAQLIRKQPQGKEQLIDANTEAVEIALKHLHDYRQLWQARFNKLETVLDDSKPG